MKRKGRLDKRTSNMIQEIAKRLQRGEQLPSIEEIAKEFAVCEHTVYNHLDDIVKQADIPGLTRDDLLVRHMPERSSVLQNRKQVKKTLDPSEFHEYCESMRSRIDVLQGSIKKVVETE